MVALLLFPPRCYLSFSSPQVVALLLRSSGLAGEPLIDESREMDYSRIVNTALPPEIRVLGWTTVPTEFNARWGMKRGDRGLLEMYPDIFHCKASHHHCNGGQGLFIISGLYPLNVPSIRSPSPPL